MFTRIEQPWLKRSSSHIPPQLTTAIAVVSAVDPLARQSAPWLAALAGPISKAKAIALSSSGASFMATRWLLLSLRNALQDLPISNVDTPLLLFCCPGFP